MSDRSPLFEWLPTNLDICVALLRHALELGAFPCLRPDLQESEIVMPPEGEEFLSLPDAQSAVGGYVEVVSLMPWFSELMGGDDFVLLVDEDGRMKSLPRNNVASVLAGRFIVGPALIVPRRSLG